jgi:hypothetical protein
MVLTVLHYGSEVLKILAAAFWLGSIVIGTKYTKTIAVRIYHT